MVKISVIADDNCVVKDGVARFFSFDIDPEIHAVQWNQDKGHIEFKDDPAPNQVLGVGDYEQHVKPYVDAYDADVVAAAAAAQEEQDNP